MFTTFLKIYIANNKAIIKNNTNATISPLLKLKFYFSYFKKGISFENLYEKLFSNSQLAFLKDTYYFVLSNKTIWLRKNIFPKMF